MLPPVLSLLKNRLEEKGWRNRSEHQNLLLEELKILDQSYEVKTLIERREFRAPMIVSGSGPCPCCGS